MSAAIFNRRRAERFAQLIDEASGARRQHKRSTVDDELADLLSVTRRVSDLPIKVESQPEFRDGLRAMLMATIEREGIGATATHPEPEEATGLRARLRLSSVRSVAGRRNTRARGAIVVGLAAGTLALSGMSAASGDAIPGDALYSVKRSTERAQLALAGSDISRGQLYLEFAKTRLDEAQAVRNDPAGLDAVLDDMDAETRQGVKLLTTAALDRRDAAALNAIDDFAKAQRLSASKLREGASGAGRSRLESSITLLDDATRRSTELRTVLQCGTAAAGVIDTLGPKPTALCRPTGQRQTGPQTGPAGEPAGSGAQRQGGSTDSAPGTPDQVAPSVEAGSSATPPAGPTPSSPSGDDSGKAQQDGGILDVIGDLFD